ALVLMAWQGVNAVTLQLYSLNPGRVGEYQTTGAIAYQRDFMAPLEDAAVAIRNDWLSRPDRPDRAARVATFAAGLLPYRLPEAYVFELLVSYRRYCAEQWQAWASMADYIHVMVPWLGPIESLVPGRPSFFPIVWQKTTELDTWPQTM